MQNTILRRSLGFAVALLATLALQLILASPAHAAAIVWNGSAGDSDLGTAANWVGGVAPVDGDTLVFDSDEFDYSSYSTVLNNSALTTIAGITLQGVNTAQAGSVQIDGSGLILTADITDTTNQWMSVNINIDITLGADIQTAAGHFGNPNPATLDLSSYTLTIPSGGWNTIYSTISGTGGLVIDGSVLLSAENTFTGSTQLGVDSSVTTYAQDAFGDASGPTTMSAGASIYFCSFNYSEVDMTIAEDITISGGNEFGDITIESCGNSADGLVAPDTSFTFSGTFTLNGDVAIRNNSKNVVFDDVVDNSNTLSQYFSSIGTLSVGGVVQDTPPQDVMTIDAGDISEAAYVYISNNQKYIIDGVRGDTTVAPGGILNGTGTVGALTVQLDGTLAPGLSPGCLSSGNLMLAGNFDVEIDGATVCTQYDQTDVTGTVDVTGGTLNILKLASYDPADGGAVFIIINNDGADTVTGEFTGLAEGTTTTVDGVEYTVSYVGGDGNDVTLTVAAVEAAAADDPDAPDTGFSSTTVNFAFIAMATALATGGMVIAGRKL